VSERVYEFDKSELEELKKVLSYDPYLDTSLIPPAPKGSDKPADKQTPEEKKELEEHDKKVAETHKFLAEDPKGKYIFSRQQYEIKDGASIGAAPNLSFLYLNATDDFLGGAEMRFKSEFKTIKRADKSSEEKIINAIKEEQERANVGFGSIFGN